MGTSKGIGIVKPSHRENDLIFCETFESKLREYELLTLVKDQFTGTGFKLYESIKSWLDRNTDRYLTIKE